MKSRRAMKSLVFIGLLLSSFQNCANLDAPSGTNGALTADSVAPDILISKVPASLVSATSVTFEFASTDNSATFECSINRASFVSCTSPMVYNNLIDGTYRVEIRAVDAAGNSSEVGTHTFQVNRAALAVEISTSILAFTNQRNFSIAFAKGNVNAPASGFECKVDFIDYAPCTSPYNLSNLNEGDHAVQIRARAPDGNYSPAAALTFRIDLSAPTVVFSSGPNGNADVNSNVVAAVFVFGAQDLGGSQVKTVTCQLDGGAQTNCTNQATYQIEANGTNHTFTVRVTDNAGNTSTWPRNFSFTYLDDNPPPPPGDGGAP